MGEVRLGLRLIVKQPILSLTIILALATGICFATMGFTFRDEMVNSTLPYQAGDRFARFIVFEPRGGRSIWTSSVTTVPRRADASITSALSAAALHGRASDRAKWSRFAGATDHARDRCAWLDAAPIAGRTLIPADGEPGAERVVSDSRKLVAAPLRRRSEH